MVTTEASSAEPAAPTRFVLVRNMFDKDQETDPDWQVDVGEEFREECAKFGTLEQVIVRYLEPGGKIYAQFATVEGAQKCARALQGRWFDKRQLAVEYVDEMPPEADTTSSS